LAAIETQPKLSRRVVKIVVLLLGLSAALILSLSSSDAFGRWLISFAVESACADGQAKITLDGVSGSITGGLIIDSARIIRRSPALDVSIKDIRFAFNFERLLKAGVVSVSGSSGHIEVLGTLPARVPFPDLPAYHGAECLAALPTNVEIAEFSIASARLVPLPELPGEVKVGRLVVAAGENKGEQSLQFSAVALWKNRQVASASFSGLLRQRQRRLDGKIDLCVAGQKVASEFKLVQKRKKPEISGYIASASIDVAKLSLWLGPLWQNHLPLGFDGHLDCTGSWLFNSEVGFLGNLSGKCQQLRVVALGFYFTLLELNGDWKLFDGNFVFDDSGSSVLGFAAELKGQIDSVVKPERNWRLHLACPIIDFARLADALPWGLKYSLELPDLSGSAALTINLSGRAPDLAARVSTDGLMVAGKDGNRKIHGHAGYRQTGLSSASLALDFVTESRQVLPPIFTRFSRGHASLTQMTPVSGLVNFNWKLSGPPLGDLKFRGNVTDNGKEISVLEGFWKSGAGHLRAFLAASAEDSPYVADGMTFLDLLFAR